MNEDQIKVENCINNHNNSYSLKQFLESQIIDENEIKCDLCENKKYLYKDNFFICSCKKKICQLCMIKHTKNNALDDLNEHNILYYNKRYSICNKHLIEFISYCSFCNSNLCEKCEKEHQNHKKKIILFKQLITLKKKCEIEKEINDNILKIKEYNE